MTKLKNRLSSVFGEKLDRAKPLPEYPRPQFKRENFEILNGEWTYRVLKKEDSKELYRGKILVPFSPETELSAVERMLNPDEVFEYRRLISSDFQKEKERLLLHFGAVDQECEVFVNGEKVGEHKGGYTGFTCDISEYCTEESNVLLVRGTDATELLPHARGKQRWKKNCRYSSIFYTGQSGIWKSVWLEKVPKSYLTDVKITPDFDETTVHFHFSVNADLPEEDRKTVRIQIFEPQIYAESAKKIEEDSPTQDCKKEVKKNTVLSGKTEEKSIHTEGMTLLYEAEGIPGEDFLCKIERLQPWTTESPYLYPVLFHYGEDRVESYFAMRKLSIGKDKAGILRFFLNNEPLLFNGLLDQGYWPESLMTAPSDEALLYDILKTKDYGFNTIRKHMKVEPDRFYYHCDREGVFVWQDMPCGGGAYNHLFVTEFPNVWDKGARGIKDNKYKLFARTDKAGREQYYKDLEEMVKELYNHPSIVLWTPFNEGWGQFDAPVATAMLRKWDDTRLINEACGWFDQGGGDLYSIHNYRYALKIKPQKDRVVALTEYGGYAFPVKEHLWSRKEFGYKFFSSKEEVTAAYEKLWERDIFPNVEKGLSATIYTQTTDIEEEINGLMTYDRKVDKLRVDTLRKLSQRLMEIYLACF
jgi:glycoside hydrolase family 2 sugar binding